LAIDAALDAERMGAVIRHYTTVDRLARAADGGWTAELFDSHAPERRARVQARYLLNTAGAWVDRMNALAASGGPAPSRKIVAVKGARIAVRLPEACRGHAFAGLNREGEHMFCMPWGDLHYIGPTENVYEGDIADVRPDESDIEFLLDEINHMLPGAKLDRGRVEFAWAGARAITFDPNRAKGRRMPFAVTYDLADDNLKGAATLSWATIMFHRQTAAEFTTIVGRHVRPSKAPQAISYAPHRFPENQNAPPLLDTDTEIKLSDLRHAAAEEGGRHLADLLYRRTGLAWKGPVPPAAARRAAEAVADILGWLESDIAREVADYQDYVRRYHLRG
jgi:glycerol-3-phosphate dehydrogenase